MPFGSAIQRSVWVVVIGQANAAQYCSQSSGSTSSTKVGSPAAPANFRSIVRLTLVLKNAILTQTLTDAGPTLRPRCPWRGR